jgi:glycosyltransferase involved in cell wall biosynthesis
VTRIEISLITVGDPATLSGGYLYHRRMAEAASRHEAVLSFVSFPDILFPLPTMAGGSVVRAARRSDIVVLDSIAACYASVWLRSLPAHLPVVGMLHQPPGGIDHGLLKRWVTARLDMFAYAKVTRLFVASESLKVAVVEAGLPGGEVVVVPPGRDVAATPVHNDLDLRASRRIAALCVANWMPRKGVLDVLDALAPLPDDYITLHLVGEERVGSRYGRRVAARVKRPDLRGRVVRHGPVTRREVASLYRSADVFVLPSLVEPYGTVIGEAMAEGLPVLGYRAGNLPYLADHGKEAFMAPPGDVEALSRYLKHLTENQAVRLRAGRAARERARSFPTWHMTAAAFFGGLREILKES